MSQNNFNSRPDPLEQAEQLSATGMFLRALESDAAVPQELSKTGPVAPGSNASVPAASGPGEFTQMFQAVESRSTWDSPSATVQPASTPTPLAPALEAQASSAPGEFTRIFVSPSAPNKEQPAKTAVEVALPLVPSPSRMKGFSTPGISDSASAEGGFTQFFKAAPSTPVASVSPPVQQVQASTPTPVQSPARDWPREPDFSVGSKTFAADPAPASGGATGLLSALSGPDAYASASRQPEAVPYRPEPFPSHAPVSPARNSEAESGGVTRFIQQLSQTPREAAPEPVVQTWAEPTAPSHASLGQSSSPGEFTRIISGDNARPAVGGPATPDQHAQAPAQAVAAPVAAPLPAMPAAPVFKAPAPPPAPKLEPPAIVAPKLAPPALAAPKGKLEAMVPILLVVNTFLLVVLLVVVIFAMRSK